MFMIHGHTIELWHLVVLFVGIVGVSIGLGCMLVYALDRARHHWRVRQLRTVWRQDNPQL